MNKLKNLYHYLTAWWYRFINGNPSGKLFVIGVTGTKGKSLTAELINTVLETAGKKTALLTSVRNKIGEVSTDNQSGNTMPGRGYIQKFLERAVEVGAEYAIIEVTSQGVVQHRHRFIDWDAGVFLNLHPEHIESHGGFENYREAKLDFFRYAAQSPKPKKYFFINKDDENAEYFVRAAGDNQKIFFGGTFLKADYAAAEAVGRALGINEEIITLALNSFKGLSGRMEAIVTKPFKVIVDYAHTPDSLEEVYKSLTLEIKISNVNAQGAGRMIGVLGSAGGGRDKWKRPKMGEVAAKYCDEIIITNEDPWDEDPNQIINEVASGAENKGKSVYKIIDRQEAINKAIMMANPGDIVIITGKGSEKLIRMANGEKLAWSEREAVLNAMADRSSSVSDAQI